MVECATIAIIIVDDIFAIMRGSLIPWTDAKAPTDLHFNQGSLHYISKLFWGYSN